MTTGVLFNMTCGQLLIGCLVVWRGSGWAVYVVDTLVDVLSKDTWEKLPWLLMY